MGYRISYCPECIWSLNNICSSISLFKKGMTKEKSQGILEIIFDLYFQILQFQS